MSPTGLLRARYLLPLGSLLVFAAIGFALRSVLVALGVAFLIAYVLSPAVDYLHALRLKRSVAALLVLVTFLGIALVAILAGLPGLVREVFEASAEASTRIPAQLEAFKERAGTLLWDRFHLRIPTVFEQIGGKFTAELRNLMPNPSDIAGAFSQTMKILATALGSLIVPVFAYYLLVDFNGIKRGLHTLIPRRIAPGLESLAKEVDSVLLRYIHKQAIKSVFLAVLYAIGFRIVGIRLGIQLGIMTGILAFIPYVGVAVGTLLAILMALIDGQVVNHLAGVMLVVSIVIAVDTWLITPGIIGASAPLKSLEVLLAMIGCVTVFGMVGVVFAVPLGAVVKILLRRINKAYLDSHFYRDIPGPEPAVATTKIAELVPEYASSGRATIPPPGRTSIPPDARTSIPPPGRTSIPPDARTSIPPDARTSVPPEARASVPPPIPDTSDGHWQKIKARFRP